MIFFVLVLLFLHQITVACCASNAAASAEKLSSQRGADVIHSLLYVSVIDS
jgi:hypothetical protein